MSRNEASIPNPALEPLNVLIGEWKTVGTHPYVPGTTFHGHTFTLFVQTENEIDPELLRATLDESAGIDIAIADDDLTSTIDAAGKDAIQIGRIQTDLNIAGGFWLWIVSDNLRRSSALNAVLIAEEYLSRFAN